MLPGRRKVLVSVKPAFGDTDVAVYDKSAKSLDQRSRILRKSVPRRRETDAVTSATAAARSRSGTCACYPPRAKSLNAA